MFLCKYNDGQVIKWYKMDTLLFVFLGLAKWVSKGGGRPNSNWCMVSDRKMCCWICLRWIKKDVYVLKDR